MFDDLRTALRSLRASPTFTTVALTVLALGIGAGTAIFSVVDAVVLRGLPFDEHDRIVAVLDYDTRRPETFGGGRTTPQTYLDWRRLQESFEAIAGVESGGPLQSRSESGEPVESQGLRVTHALQMLEAVRLVPAVTAASAVSGGVPLTGSWSRNRIELPGKGLVNNDDSLDRRIVTPEYLQTLGIPLIRGRYLSVEDREGSPKVAVINETAAKKYWPNADAIGQTFKMNSQETTVVGIVGDIRHLGPEVPARQESYVPLAQNTVIGVTLVMRTRGDALAALPAVKSAIWSVNKEQRVNGDVFTMEGYMDRLIAQPGSA